MLLLESKLDEEHGLGDRTHQSKRRQRGKVRNGYTSSELVVGEEKRLFGFTALHWIKNWLNG